MKQSAMITRQTLAFRLRDYLQPRITREALVDWAERAMMDEGFDDRDLDALRDITSRLATILVLVFCATAVSAQVGTPIPSKFPGPDESFEIASVKANRSGAQQWDFDAPPGRVTGTNVLLRDLIRFASLAEG